jgi:hypothetical protein
VSAKAAEIKSDLELIAVDTCHQENKINCVIVLMRYFADALVFFESGLDSKPSFRDFYCGRTRRGATTASRPGHRPGSPKDQLRITPSARLQSPRALGSDAKGDTSMSKIKRAVGAAACAVGITVGAIAMAAPASAAVYVGDYNCPGFGTAQAEFDRNSSGNLTVTADVSNIITGVNASVSADLTWTSPALSINDVNGAVDTSGIVVLTKSSVASFSIAPDDVDLTVPNLSTTDPNDNIVVHCDRTNP